MPGLRYGNDITDTAQQMRDIAARIRADLQAPNLSKAKRGALENSMRAHELAIKEIFGSTRTMDAFAKHSMKNTPKVKGPDGDMYMPALPKHLHRRAKELGVKYSRKGKYLGPGMEALGKTTADDYSPLGRGRPTIQGGLDTARAEKRKRDQTIGRRDRRRKEKQRRAGGA